jgi:catechol 2,3-dioxygenase-like lactoylglutathione lyase family enzyme
MKAIGLHHVRLAVTDLEKAEVFGLDFGLKTVSQGEAQLIMLPAAGVVFAMSVNLAQRDVFRGWPLPLRLGRIWKRLLPVTVRPPFGPSTRQVAAGGWP